MFVRLAISFLWILGAPGAALAEPGSEPLISFEDGQITLEDLAAQNPAFVTWLGMGTTPLLLQLERTVARFFGAEDAACVASGYLSTAAGVQALRAAGAFDVAFVDEHAHYCRNCGTLLPRPGHEPES